MALRLHTYATVWYMTAKNALQVAFINRGTNALFMLGKIIRLAMTLLFLLLLKQRNLSIGDYTPSQVVVFFLTYQLIDTIAQVFYRGVYEFGQIVRSGEFDAFLIRPISSLFRALTGKPDINDALFFIPTAIVTGYLITHLGLTITLSSVIWYLLLLLNSLLIATGLHVLVVTFGVLTTEVDNLIWLYRDLTRLGQFPITIYLEPLRTALFLIIPIGLMFTIPAQVLLNTAPTYTIGASLIIGSIFFLVSLRLWRWSLRHYSSASS